MTGWLKDLTGDLHIALPVASICMAGAGLAALALEKMSATRRSIDPATMRA